MVLDAFLLNTQHYKVRIKGKVEQSREGVASSPTPWCSSYRKGSLRVTLDYGRQLYLLYLCSMRIDVQVSVTFTLYEGEMQICMLMLKIRHAKVMSHLTVSSHCKHLHRYTCKFLVVISLFTLHLFYLLLLGYVVFQFSLFCISVHLGGSYFSVFRVQVIIIMINIIMIIIIKLYHLF